MGLAKSKGQTPHCMDSKHLFSNSQILHIVDCGLSILSGQFKGTDTARDNKHLSSKGIFNIQHIVDWVYSWKYEEKGAGGSRLKF